MMRLGDRTLRLIDRADTAATITAAALTAAAVAYQLAPIAPLAGLALPAWAPWAGIAATAALWVAGCEADGELLRRAHAGGDTDQPADTTT